jgi:hypothetical protein
MAVSAAMQEKDQAKSRMRQKRRNCRPVEAATLANPPLPVKATLNQRRNGDIAADCPICDAAFSRRPMRRQATGFPAIAASKQRPVSCYDSRQCGLGRRTPTRAALDVNRSGRNRMSQQESKIPS